MKMIFTVFNPSDHRNNLKNNFIIHDRKNHANILQQKNDNMKHINQETGLIFF